MYAIGIDLGGTNIKAALIGREQGLVRELSIPTEADEGKDHVIGRITYAVKELLQQGSEKVMGIGLGTPGMVAPDLATVMDPPNLKGWGTVPLASEIEQRTGIRCVIENDANLAALGSARFGVGKENENFIMITLGTGVGGGLIINNQLYRGVTGMAGELGHVIIKFDGPASNSNTPGTIEAYLGQRFLSRNAAERIRKQPDDPLFRKFGERLDTLEPVDIYDAAMEGNLLASDILIDCGEKLGIAIVNYIHILDIRTVILSGGVSGAGEYLIGPARSTALRYLMPPFRDGFTILHEPLGNRAALFGASSLAFEEL
ncbi:MAG: ROK family protein [Balneolaceae bacterium]